MKIPGLLPRLSGFNIQVGAEINASATYCGGFLILATV